MHADLNGVDQYLLNLGNPEARAWLTDHVSSAHRGKQDRHLSPRRQHRPFELLGVGRRSRPAGHHRDTLHRRSLCLLGGLEDAPPRAACGVLQQRQPTLRFGDNKSNHQPLAERLCLPPRGRPMPNVWHQSVHPVVGQRLQGGRQVRLPQRSWARHVSVLGSSSERLPGGAGPQRYRPFQTAKTLLLRRLLSPYALLHQGKRLACLPVPPGRSWRGSRLCLPAALLSRRSGLSVQLGGVTQGAKYEVEDVDTGKKTVYQGAELADLRVTAASQPAAVVLIYRRLK